MQPPPPQNTAATPMGRGSRGGVAYGAIARSMAGRALSTGTVRSRWASAVADGSLAAQNSGPPPSRGVEPHALAVELCQRSKIQLVVAYVELLLHTENNFVCWCCVGSDRAAGVGVSLGALDLMRVDGRPCLGRCSHTTISRLRLSDRPYCVLSNFSTGSVQHVRAAVSRRVPGFYNTRWFSTGHGCSTHTVLTHPLWCLWVELH